MNGPRRREALVESADLDLSLRQGLLTRRGSAQRERWLAAVSARLDLPMSLLGIVFLLVVLAQNTVQRPAAQQVLAVIGWVLWAVFVAEFLLRLVLAPSRTRFLRTHWWQVVFLILPMLRFLRLVSLLRWARVGRVVSSAVRSSRSASRILSGRLGWLASVTVIVVLAVSQLLYTLGVFGSYDDALYATALGTVSGQPLGRPGALAHVIDVLLATYSVAVVAALAGSIGAYLLQSRELGRRGRGHDGLGPASGTARRAPRETCSRVRERVAGPRPLRSSGAGGGVPRPGAVRGPTGPHASRCRGGPRPPPE